MPSIFSLNWNKNSETYFFKDWNIKFQSSYLNNNAFTAALKNLAFPSLLFSAHAFNLLTISTIFSGRESGNGASSLSISSHSDSVPIHRDLPESVVSLLDSSSTLAALTTLSIASSMLLSLPPNFFSSNFFVS